MENLLQSIADIDQMKRFIKNKNKNKNTHKEGNNINENKMPCLCCSLSALSKPQDCKQIKHSIGYKA